MLTLTDIINNERLRPGKWDELFKSRYDELLDLIVIRVKRDGIEVAMNSLIEHIYELRVLIFEELLEEQNQLNFIDYLLDRKIDFSKGKADKYDGLFVDILETFHKISFSNYQQLKLQIDDAPVKTRHQIDPSWSSARNSMKLHGVPAEFIKMGEASLKADFCFILYDLPDLSEEFQFINKKRKQLISLMSTFTENYGFYSALLKIWHPADEDEGKLVRNIKIRLAIKQLETEEPKTILNLKDLKTHLNPNASSS